MQSSKPTQGAGDVSSHRVTYLDWNEVNEPGVYVDTQYPRFFRVTKEGIIPGASPAIHGSDFAQSDVVEGADSANLRQPQPSRAGVAGKQERKMPSPRRKRGLFIASVRGRKNPKINIDQNLHSNVLGHPIYHLV